MSIIRRASPFDEFLTLRRGSFSRTLELPEGLVGDRAEATYEHGVLTLRIPKAEEVKPKQIKITATTAGTRSPSASSAGRHPVRAAGPCTAAGSTGTRPAPST